METKPTTLNAIEAINAIISMHEELLKGQKVGNYKKVKTLK